MRESANYPPDVSVAPGARIAGKYVVRRVLGQGGMGLVVAARHEVLGQDVAIKVLLPDGRRDPNAVERFLREAQFAALLSSDHVVRVMDVGQLADGAPFMVMELLEGHDLQTELAERGRLPPAEAVDFVLEAIDAIAEAHAIGVVHRDLKPSNLFLVRRGDRPPLLKILDFGISKLTGDGSALQSAGITESSSMIGSPAYMSPEQVRSSKTVDARTDIWALGIILYELLSGAPPFSAENLADLFVAILHAPIFRIPPTRHAIPAGLEDVIARALERDRGVRIASVAELAQALAPFGSGRAQPCVERAVALARHASLTPGPVAVVESSDRVSGDGTTVRANYRPDATTAGGAAVPSVRRSLGTPAWVVIGAIVCFLGVGAMVVGAVGRSNHGYVPTAGANEVPSVLEANIRISPPKVSSEPRTPTTNEPAEKVASDDAHRESPSEKAGGATMAADALPAAPARRPVASPGRQVPRPNGQTSARGARPRLGAGADPPTPEPPRGTSDSISSGDTPAQSVQRSAPASGYHVRRSIEEKNPYRP